MFKNFKKNDKYLTVSIYAFAVIAILVAIILIFINLGKINDFLGQFATAMSAFIYGFVIAYICNPIYKKFSKHVFKFVEKKKPMPRLRKALSLVATYIVFMGAITLAFVAIIPQIARNITTLAENIKDYMESFQVWATDFLNKLHEIFPSVQPEQIVDRIKEMFTGDGAFSFQSIFNYLRQHVLNFATTAVSQVFYVIVAFILSVYFLIYKDSIVARIKRILCAMFKKENYESIIDFARYTDRTFGRYILGAVCDSILVGFVVFIILTIVRIPFAPLIGVIVGITNVIPFFGPFMGAIPSGIIILIAGKPYQVLLFVLIIIIVQQIDGNLIAPHILGASTGLTPIGVIAAVTACSHLFGFVGMLIGVPLCAVIASLVSKKIDKKLKKKKLPSDIGYFSAPDVFKDEKFIKAQRELEAQSRVERMETIEKLKNENAITENAINEAEEKIINEKMQKSASSDTKNA